MDKGNPESFIEFLYQTEQSFPDILIILISDSASIHKSKKVKFFLKKNPFNASLSVLKNTTFFVICNRIC